MRTVQTVKRRESRGVGFLSHEIIVGRSGKQRGKIVSDGTSIISDAKTVMGDGVPVMRNGHRMSK